jgi:hypothetical protein
MLIIPFSTLKRHLFWHGEEWEMESEEDRKKELDEEEEDGKCN